MKIMREQLLFNILITLHVNAYFDYGLYNKTIRNTIISKRSETEDRVDKIDFCNQLEHHKNESHKTCRWFHLKSFGRGWQSCQIIIDDVILENVTDVVKFQKFYKVYAIYGNLVVRNAPISILDFDHLKYIGCQGKQNATIIIENMPRLEHFLMSHLKVIVPSTENGKRAFIIRNCPEVNLSFILRKTIRNASLNSTFEFGNPQTVGIIQTILSDDLAPAFITSFLILGVFFWHFLAREIQMLRLKEREDAILRSLVDMRDTVLASELLVQTPSTAQLKFDKPVLKSRLRNKRLMQHIENRLRSMY